MRTTDFLDQLYNPTNNFFAKEFGDLNTQLILDSSAGGGGGNIINTPVIERPVLDIPVRLKDNVTPKVNIKLSGLKNGFIKYGGKSYYDKDTLQINVLTALDTLNLKPEGANYSEYYVISFEDVKIDVPAKDVVITTPVYSGGGGGGGGVVRRDPGTGFGREVIYDNGSERRENIK